MYICFLLFLLLFDLIYITNQIIDIFILYILQIFIDIRDGKWDEFLLN